MTRVPTTTTGFRTDDLATLAAQNTDVGEPMMTSDDVAEMLAHILHFPGLFDQAANQIRVNHFLGDEPACVVIWEAVLAIRESSSVMPSLNVIATEIQSRMREISATVAQLTAPEYCQVLQPDGTLARLRQWMNFGLAFERGRLLIRRFLRERDAVEPIMQIARQTVHAGAYSGNHRHPQNVEGLIRRAAERFEEIEAEWGDQDTWPVPEPLIGPELPPFPVQVLPEALRAWVHAESIATQTPADLAAMLGLGVCAAVAAKRVDVHVRPGWDEPTNIYAVTVLESGNRKSAVFSSATEPIRNLERVQIERQRSEVANYRSRKSVLQRRLEHLERTAARASDDSQRAQSLSQIEDTNQELLNLSPVHELKMLVDDCTPERLEVILAEQGGRIATMSPEGGVFGLMKGRYSGTPNFNAYLLGHSGEDIRTDRVERGSVFVPKATITVALAVQPDVIQGLGEKPELRGQGLLARFLYSIPRSRMGSRDNNPPAVPDEVSQAYHTVVREIGHMGGQPRQLTFSEIARNRLELYMQTMEPRLGSFGDLAGLQDWASKLPGAVARLAGILHLVDQVDRFIRGTERENLGTMERATYRPWETPISFETIESAIAIGEYLIPHARAAFSLIGRKGCPEATVIRDAGHLLAWIRQQNQPVVKRRDMQQANRSRFPRAKDIDPVLCLLEDHHWIRRLQPSGNSQGGRPSTVYSVNPRIFDANFRVES